MPYIVPMTSCVMLELEDGVLLLDSKSGPQTTAPYRFGDPVSGSSFNAGNLYT